MQNDLSKSVRSHPWFMVLMFSPIFLISRTLNNDIWFLLNSGRYVLSHGIPHIEPFSIHKSFDFVMQQWLSAVLFWSAYDKLGQAGVLLVVSIVYGLLILTVFRLAHLVSNHNFYISYAITMLTSANLILFMISRPFIFSTLILTLELLVLEIYIARGKRQILAWLPLLSILLINLHAAMWPMFFILIIPYLIDSFRFKIAGYAGQGYPLRPILISSVIALFTGLINPYGIKSMTYLFRSYGHDEISTVVSEMQPININEVSGKIFLSAIALMIIIHLIYHRGTTRIRYILLTVGLIVLSLSSVRNFMLYAALAQFPLAYFLRDFSFPNANEASRSISRFVRMTIIVLIVLLIGLLTYHFLQPASKATQIQQLDEVLQSLPQPSDNVTVVLFTDYDDGGYTEFLGYPSYIDPRAEVFTIENNGQKDVMQEYFDLMSGSLHYREFLARYEFTHLLVTGNNLLSTYLAKDSDYKLTRSVGSYYLYEKIS